jgi:hypothetical protein
MFKNWRSLHHLSKRIDLSDFFIVYHVLNSGLAVLTGAQEA